MLAMTAGLAVWQAKQGLNWLAWLERLPQTATLHMESLRTFALFNTSWGPLVLIPALATLVLLGGAVLYLATEKQ
jgi:hypothetical protein